jgi:hypothetical protein
MKYIYIFIYIFIAVTSLTIAKTKILFHFISTFHIYLNHKNLLIGENNLYSSKYVLLDLK